MIRFGCLYQPNQTGKHSRLIRAANITRLAEAPRISCPEKPSTIAELICIVALSPQATEGLKAYAALIPPDDELEQPEEFGNDYESTLRRQAQLAILAFKARVAVSADLVLGGHSTPTPIMIRITIELLGNLTDSVDYLWEFAETHEVADRLVVVMGSDFGRTNHYNVDAGKDHWPIGSFRGDGKESILDQPCGRRNRCPALCAEDRTNRAACVDDANGTIIHPKHVHKALRRYFDIENSLGAQRFPFHNTEDFAFFE